MADDFRQYQLAISEEPLVDDDASENDQPLPYVYEITAYGADYPVDSLVQRMQSGAVFVPEFQRDFVWTKKQADRFVESLLLGLPVPGIFLARESEGSRLLVIDGQQRLRTLQGFYEGQFRDKPFELEDVQERFRGKTYETLEEDDRRRVNDSILHATVVRQENPSDDQSSIYFIFERINRGGTELSPQEVRGALYHGPFDQLLSTLNDVDAWREIFGKRSIRRKDQEFILRFFAFKHNRENYSRPMEEFLTKFMVGNRKMQRYPEDELESEFTSAISLVREAVGSRAFRIGQAINAAVFDSVMVGVSARLDRSPIGRPEQASAAYEALLGNGDYVDACSQATADEERVRLRIDSAVAAFANVE